MNFHFASRVAPGTRLVVAIAPEFTIGFVRPSVAALDAFERVERPPGGVHADFLADLLPAPIASQTRAKMNGLDTLMIVNS